MEEEIIICNDMVWIGIFSSFCDPLKRADGQMMNQHADQI